MEGKKLRNMLKSHRRGLEDVSKGTRAVFIHADLRRAKLGGAIISPKNLHAALQCKSK